MSAEAIQSRSQVKKQSVLAIAFKEGAKWGVSAFVLASAGMFYANKNVAFVKNKLSTSAKVGLTFMAGIGVWAFVTEETMTDARRYPQEYGIDTDMKYEREAKKKSTLKFYQRAMNYMHDNPFTMLGMLATPVAAKIFIDQAGMKHLTISQRVMHSRVLAQMSVVTLLLITMGFKSYMDRRGNFVEASDEGEAAQQQEEAADSKKKGKK